MTLFLCAVLLVFAAYGHEMFDYLWRDPEPRKQLLGYVAKIGGWGAIAGAIFGTIFSALKSAPTGGHDSGDVTESPAWQKAIFTLTPLLVMFTLMVMAAWVAHKIFNRLATSSDYPWPLVGIILVGVVLALSFALFEVRWQPWWLYLPLAIVSLIIVGIAFVYHWQHFSLPGHVNLLFFASLVGSALVFRLTLKGDRWSAGWRRLEARLLNKQPGQEEKKPGEEKKNSGEQTESAEDPLASVMGLSNGTRRRQATLLNPVGG